MALAERGSVTALGVLAGVCVAATESDPAVRFVDPIAPRLLTWRDGRLATAKVRPLHPLIRLVMERRNPGTYGYVLARTRYMDDVVCREVAAGLDQLVILGAGYDTRAYRMRAELAEVPVFEVDHPLTSRAKRARVAKALGPAAAAPRFVEVDFDHEHLLERLAAHGYDPGARTLFILSGVAPFLTEDAVRELLRQVASQSSPRTSIVFDYIYDDVLTHPDRYHGGREWVRYASAMQEHPRSGITPGTLADVLAECGLRLESELGTDHLAARYLRREDGSSVAAPFAFGCIAHAFVAA